VSIFRVKVCMLVRPQSELSVQDGVSGHAARAYRVHHEPVVRTGPASKELLMSMSALYGLAVPKKLSKMASGAMSKE